MRPTPPRLLIALTLLLAGAAPVPTPTGGGTLPTDKDGRPLNFDFETGDLRDWAAEGAAFAGQPVEGDAVFARRKDMHSRHAGRFWVGSFERKNDQPTGTLTSVPFTLTKPYARFLIAGGARPTTRLEIVRADTDKIVYQASGDDTEELKPVAADLSAHVGKELFLRLIDNDGNGWGHLNFDDFRLWETRPPGPLRAGPTAPDLFAHEGLSPLDAAAAMTVPPGFKVTLFAGEPDVVQPIAFAVDDRGRLWVAEAYSYPVRVPEAEARDRILIFEDTDGDGRFDSRKVFTDRLNLVSGLEVGFGGVWVGAAPNFLFIPDADGDDRPDGPPQVLLDGWGHHDTHETLNSFAWGPDGWLYGCHGVFTHSKVGPPGTPEAGRVPINAGIWRYHPTRHAFEVFAHGTSNPWGVDFDANAQAFLTSCVIPHLYHVIQGARYERQAGPHFNPYTYDDIKTIADHRHYVGANPHAGNGRSDEAGGGHAHSGAMIYQGDSWPAEYRGSLFMNNIHGARLNRDTLERKGSGFVGHHAPDFLLANDRWSQVVSIRQGPHGDAYMIDWYDKNQCHRNEVAAHDRTNGRIFRIRHGDHKPEPVAGSYEGGMAPWAVIHSDEWISRRARRRLQERGIDEKTRATLVRFAFEPGLDLSKEPRPDTPGLRTGPVRPLTDSQRLRALLALNAGEGLTEQEMTRGLRDPGEYLRAWTVQLATERGRPPSAVLSRFAELAKTDPSPVVRLYVASALQRLPLADRWPILDGLVANAEDAHDHNLPLMVWYAAEPLAGADPGRALALALGAKLPDLLPFMARRVAAVGSPEAFAMLVETVGRADSEAVRLAIVDGLNDALKGRRRVTMPPTWPATYAALRRSGDARLRSQATALAVTFGDPSALRDLRAVLADRGQDLGRRREALDALVKARDPELSAALRGLLAEPTLRGQALRGLAAFDDPATGPAILDAYSGLSPEERRDALNTLAARVDSSRSLLGAVAEGRVPTRDLSADLVRQLRNHKNPQIDATLGKVWGTVRETSGDKAKLIARYRAMLTAKPGRTPDPELGRATFARTCQQCHTLFGTGGKVGPELTGSNRADLDYVLTNVLDPSALIGKDYLAHVVATADGRVLTGIVRAEDKDALILQTANEVVVIPRGEIEQRRPSDQSMMPDDLWAPLSEHEIRSLVAYLAGPGQVPILATADNLPAFFNGRDLTGWVGDPALWSVRDGEVVGKTDGLKHNAFLSSEMSAEDFRLTVRVKLVGDRGNSGIQFRSAPLPGGEMKGDQADVGPGWWGKIYEENGRGLLWPQSGEAHVRPGEWNTYEVVAVGPSVRTRINGKPCAVLDDPKGARRGVFAFQLHSGDATEVHYKDIKLELNPRLGPDDARSETGR